MQRPPFFPDPYFGWTFYAILVGLVLLGAYFDFRKAVLPKALTLTLLGLGFGFNTVRGAWLGYEGSPLWLLRESSGLALGAVDGFLFALIGAASALALFVFLWIMRTCGGGDVKLFVALGAWVGFWHVVYIMLASMPVLAVMFVFHLLTGSLKPMAVQKRIKESQVIKGGPGKGKWRMTYAFPVAVGTALLLLWFYRVDLRLASPPNTPAVSQAEAHND